MYQRIEFMGLPGAGKTTLINGFLNHLSRYYPHTLSKSRAILRGIHERDDGIIRNIAKKFPAVVWEPLSGMRNALPELHLFATENTALLGHILTTASQEEMAASARQCNIYTFFQTAAEHQLLMNTLDSRDVVVFEEGFLQAGSMLFGYLPSRKISSEDVTHFIDLLPPVNQLIWVDTDPEECFARLKLRDELPVVLQKESEHEVLFFLGQAKKCFEIIASEMSNRGIRVHRVKNHDGYLERCIHSLEKISREFSVEEHEHVHNLSR